MKIKNKDKAAAYMVLDLKEGRSVKVKTKSAKQANELTSQLGKIWKTLGMNNPKDINSGASGYLYIEYEYTNGKTSTLEIMTKD